MTNLIKIRENTKKSNEEIISKIIKFQAVRF